MEVVDRISVSPTGAAGPFKQEAPIDQVVIQKIELLADSGAPVVAPTPAPTPAAPPPAASETPPAGDAGQAPADQAATPASDTPPPK
jgi:hypothetical protein